MLRRWRPSLHLLAPLISLVIACTGCVSGGEPPPASELSEPPAPTALPPRRAPTIPRIAQIPDPTGKVVSVTDFGADGTDDVDDTAALQKAFDSLSPGDRLLLPAGTYHHNAVLRVSVPNVQIVGPGARLVADNEARSSFLVDADGVFVGNLEFDAPTTAKRWTANEQMKVRIGGHNGVTLWHITVDGSAAAGIFVGDGAGSFRIEGVDVRNTRADGVHMTAGAHDGLVLDATVERSGDDGVAVVSYDPGTGLCHDIIVESPRVLGTTWGRGVSVVGGSKITYRDVTVDHSYAAGVYVAVEGKPYNTQPVSDVTVDGSTLTRANYSPDIDHGSVMVFTGRPGPQIDGVTISNLTISDTRASASRNISVVSVGAAPTGLTFSGIVIHGGPAAAFGGNVPSNTYTVRG